MASLDGICKGDIVEIKCSKNCYDKVNEGIIDPIYNAQMQFQMYVVDVDRMYYAAFWDNQLKIINVFRDDEFLDEIMQKVEEFYQCMINFESPELVDCDYVIREDCYWKKAALHYSECNRMIKYYENEAAKFKQELINLSEGINTKGCGLSLCHVTRKGTLDYGRIFQENKIIDIEQYRKPSINNHRITIDK